MKKATKSKTSKKVVKTKAKPTPKISGQLIYVKEHQREYLGYNPRVVIAMCDAKLMGSIHADAKTGATLNLQNANSFYIGEKVNEKQAAAILAKYANYERASFNLTGDASIKLASQYFNVSKAKKIGKALHLEIYRL